MFIIEVSYLITKANVDEMLIIRSSDGCCLKESVI